MSPKPTTTTTKKNAIRIGPTSDSENACTDWITPERVRNVPRMVRARWRPERQIPDAQEPACALLHETE